MIALFDTNIYIDYLKGTFPQSAYQKYFHDYIIRISPVVYHELLRGLRSEGLKKKVEKVIGRIVFLPPPTEKMWVKAAELAGAVTGSHDEIGLEKIQNDLLIALTAKAQGATLITQDKHFKTIQKYVPLRLIFHRS